MTPGSVNTFVYSRVGRALAMAFGILLSIATPAVAEDVNKLKQQRSALQHQMRLLDQQKAQANKSVSAAQKTLSSLKSKHGAAKREKDQRTPGAKHAVAEQKKALEQMRTAERILDAVAEEIELNQSADSPIVKAKVEFAVKLDRYKTLLDQVKQSDEYQRRLKELKSADAAGDKIAELHDRFIKQNYTVKEAFYEQRGSRGRYEKLRDELLENHPKWKKAQQDLESARYLHKIAERSADSAAKLLASAASKELSASRKVKALSARIKTAQAGVKRIDAARAHVKRQIDALSKRIGKR